MSEGTKVARLQGKVVDIEKASIDELHTLERHIRQQKKIEIRRNAHNLLVKELGDDYEVFIRERKVSVKGNNGKTYVVHVNGYIESYLEDGSEDDDGQLIRTGYPAEDAIVTFIKYAKLNAGGLDNLWGCGNISMKGGELKAND